MDSMCNQDCNQDSASRIIEWHFNFAAFSWLHDGRCEDVRTDAILAADTQLVGQTCCSARNGAGSVFHVL